MFLKKKGDKALRFETGQLALWNKDVEDKWEEKKR